MLLAVGQFVLKSVRILIASLCSLFALIALLTFINWAVVTNIADLWTGFMLLCQLVCAVAAAHLLLGRNRNITIRFLTVPGVPFLLLAAPYYVINWLDPFWSSQSPAWKTWWESGEPVVGLVAFVGMLIFSQWVIDFIWARTASPSEKMKPAG